MLHLGWTVVPEENRKDQKLPREELKEEAGNVKSTLRAKNGNTSAVKSVREILQRRGLSFFCSKPMFYTQKDDSHGPKSHWPLMGPECAQRKRL